MFFDPKLLADTMETALKNRGVASESAHHVVSSLIQTSLRGVDSHGINLFPHYCRAVEAGRINRAPAMLISPVSAAVSTIDADHAFGHHAGAVAMDLAIEHAKSTGIGAVSVRNSTHFGAAAYFGLRAAKSDCLGFAFTNADALVKAFGAKKAFFGTNPICFTAPMTDEEPFCLDMATSLVSWNKIKNYRRERKSIPPHWAFDSQGRSVTDPEKAITLNPAGEYKGFGLGMMVDILCSLLAGSFISNELRPMYSLPLDDSKRCLSHFFMVIDIARFIEVATFKRNLQNMVNAIRALEPLVSGGAVMAAGDPEKLIFRQRSEHGIPLDDAIYRDFSGISGEFAQVVK